MLELRLAPESVTDVFLSLVLNLVFGKSKTDTSDEERMFSMGS
jgi:hypothetical protein